MGRRLLSVVCLVLAVSHDPERDDCHNNNNQLLELLCGRVVTQVRTNILSADRGSDLHAERTRGQRRQALRLLVSPAPPSTATRDCPSRLAPIIEKLDSLPIKKKLNMQVISGTLINDNTEEEDTNRHVTSRALEPSTCLTSSRGPAGGVTSGAYDNVMRQFQNASSLMRQFQNANSLCINITAPDKLQADPKLSLLHSSTRAMILLENINLSFKFSTVTVVCCLDPCIVTIYITSDHVPVSYQVEEKEMKNNSDTSWTDEASSKPTLGVWFKAGTFPIQELETTYRTLANTLRTVLHNLLSCLYSPYVKVVTIAFHIILSPLYQLFSIFSHKSPSLVFHKQSVNVGIGEINNGDSTLNEEKIIFAETEHIPDIRHGYLGQSVVTFIVLLMLVFIPHLRDSIFGLNDLCEDHQCGGDHYFDRWLETCFAEGCHSEKKSFEDCKIPERSCDGSSCKSSKSLSKETTFWKHVRGNFCWKLFRKTHTSTKNSDSQKPIATWGKHENFAPLWLTGFHVWPLDRFLPDASRNPEQDMAYLGYRLASLGALPVTCGVSRLKLANAGFYYRGQGDEVVCYSCRVRHSGWRSSDDPFAVHRRISPHCSHLAKTIDAPPNYQTGEHGSQGHEASGSRSGSEVVGGARDQTEDGESREQDANDAVPNSFSSGPSRTTPSAQTSAAEAGSHSAIPGGQASRSLFPSPTLDLGGAVYPMYQDMASRRRSFARWDETRAPPLDDILLNGMFYAGELMSLNFCLYFSAM